jgi:hypothetical protein
MALAKVDLSYLVNRTPLDSVDVLLPLFGARAQAEGISEGALPLRVFNASNLTSATVASGNVTPTRMFHTLTTAGASADVDNILGDLDMVIVFAASGKTLTFRHNASGTGNIRLPGGFNYTLGDTQTALLLVKDQDVDLWQVHAIDTTSINLTNAVDTQMTATALTVTQSKVKVVLPLGATSATLDTINNPQSVGVIFLSLKNSGNTLTLSEGQNVALSGREIVLSDTDSVVAMVWNRTTSKWSPLETSGNFVVTNEVPTQTVAAMPLIDFVPNTRHIATQQMRVTPRYIERKKYFDQVQSGTTFVTYNGSVITAGTPSDISGTYGNAGSFVRLDRPATINTWNYRASPAIFQFRHNPYFRCNAVANSFSLAVMGLLTALPTVDGGGNFVWTGISGIASFIFTSSARVVNFVINNGTLSSLSNPNNNPTFTGYDVYEIAADTVQSAVYFKNPAGTFLYTALGTLSTLQTASLRAYVGILNHSSAPSGYIDFKSIYCEQN